MADNNKLALTGPKNLLIIGAGMIGSAIARSNIPTETILLGPITKRNLKLVDGVDCLKVADPFIGPIDTTFEGLLNVSKIGTIVDCTSIRKPRYQVPDTVNKISEAMHLTCGLLKHALPNMHPVVWFSSAAIYGSNATLERLTTSQAVGSDVGTSAPFTPNTTDGVVAKLRWEAQIAVKKLNLPASRRYIWNMIIPRVFGFGDWFKKNPSVVTRIMQELLFARRSYRPIRDAIYTTDIISTADIAAFIDEIKLIDDAPALKHNTILNLGCGKPSLTILKVYDCVVDALKSAGVPISAEIIETDELQPEMACYPDKGMPVNMHLNMDLTTELTGYTSFNIDKRIFDFVTANAQHILNYPVEVPCYMDNKVPQ